jgi:poly(3-hydroxybutyrate) depolymerase
MKFKFCYSLAVIATMIVSQALAQQTAKLTSNGIAYLEYLPQGYNSNTNKYPLVIFLHGIVERGTTSTDAATQLKDVLRVANVGIPQYVKNGQQYPFILISPQLKSSYGNWPADYVMSVLNYIKTKLRVDERRIYITGLSLGGGGTWTTACAYPSVFAAIAPVCGANNVLSRSCALASENVATWAFHGDADPTVNYTVTTKMVTAVNACTPKPSPLAKLTIYPGGSHIIWDKAYKETNVLSWMLTFVNGTTAPTPTTTNAVPIAHAGGDQTKTLPTNTAVLSGSGSDTDGTIASYSWSKVSGPNTPVLTNPTSASASVSSLIAGAYVFRLKVTDNKGATATDDIQITVNPAVTTTNIAPVAHAGGDQIKTLPFKSATIAGSGSDQDGTITSYAWSQVSGPNTAVMNNKTYPAFSLSGCVAGVYVFRLKVTDNKGASGTDDVKITIRGATVAASTTSTAMSTVAK